MNVAGYQTLIVRFSEPIKALDGIFDDAEAWGVDTLKGWIDSYESSRFTATPFKILFSQLWVCIFPATFSDTPCCTRSL